MDSYHQFEFMRSCEYIVSTTSRKTTTPMIGHNYDLNILDQLNIQRAAGKHVDVTILLRNNLPPLLVHGSLISIYSPVVDAMLSSSMIESRTKQIDMSAYDPRSVTDLFDYMYTSKLTFTPYNIIDLLEITSAWLMEFEQDSCLDYLRLTMTPDNIHCIYELFTILKAKCQVVYALNYMACNIHTVSSLDVFLELPQDEFRYTLDKCNRIHRYRKRHCVDIFDTLVNYVLRDTTNRIQLLDEAYTIMPDLEFIPPLARAAILHRCEHDDVTRQKILDLFTRIPSVNDFEAYDSSSKIIHIINKSRIQSLDDEIAIYPTDYLRILNYDHLIRLKVYCTTATEITDSGAAVRTITGFDLTYITHKCTHIGNTDYDVTMCGRFELLVPSDERIIDVIVDIDGIEDMKSITFITNLKQKFGPYGTQIRLSSFKCVSLLPPECVNRSDCYLYGIGKTPYSIYGNTIVSNINSLMFTWIY